MRFDLLWATLGLTAALLLPGCDGPTCEAGLVRECPCIGAGPGAQTCAADGSRWEECLCEAADSDADIDADVDSDVDGDVDADSDGDAPADADIEGPRRLDVLFVVDNSSSMTQEQGELASQVGVLFRELLSPTRDGTGALPPAVEDLHVGVVSTDMGTLGWTMMTCSDPVDGDGGELQSEGHGAGCAAGYSAAACDRPSGCPWLDHSAESPDDGRDPTNPPIWEDLGCIASLGTTGCGFEMQLEAGLVALTDAAAPGSPNEGFLREDAGLVVVFVTDEDDCSSGNSRLFDPGATDLPPLGVRCALRAELLFNLNRYYAGLTDLKPGREDEVLVVGIVGLPLDGSWEPGDPIEDLLALVQVDPANPSALLPVCATAMGAAYAPARIADLVSRFGSNGILLSICEADWSEGFRSIARRIQSQML